MRVMGAQQQATYAHIPHGYYLPHAGDNLQQQQQQQQQQNQQQPFAFAAPPPHYPYDHTQPQHQPLPFHPPPYSSPQLPYAYPQQYPVEEPFVPADPSLRNEFFFAVAGNNCAAAPSSVLRPPPPPLPPLLRITLNLLQLFFAGFFVGFFLPIVWCSGWLFFR
jgi:hypothetical protein